MMKAYQNLSIKWKITLLCVTLSFTSVALAAIMLATVELKQLKPAMVAEASMLATIVGDNCKGSLIFDDADSAKEVLVSLKSVPEVLGARIFNAEGKPFAHYMKDPEAKVEEFLPEAKPEIEHQFMSGYLEIVVPLESENGVAGHAYLKMATTKLQETISRISVTATTVVICCLVLATVLALFAQRMITGPLRQTVAVLKDIAEGDGDLTQRVTISAGGELGELARNFNTFVEKLHGIVTQVSEKARAVSQASKQLTGTATSMTGSASSMSQQSTTAAAAAEEMSVNITSMANSAEQISENIRNVSQSIEQMTESIGAISNNADEASTSAKNASALASQSNDTIQKLGTAADEIGEVVSTIEDIAQQTNLLALNATIEAARAGESGKGFAVVASEVQSLAKQTATATEDIRQKIGGIQDSSVESVKAIAEMTEVIATVSNVSGKIAAAVEEQTVTTQQIARNMNDTTTAASTVSTGVTQSATASREISENIASVDSGVKSTASSANETQIAGSQLASLADGLNQLVDQFKL